MERRAEAHARYASGILRELNEDPGGQLDEWTRVVELDPDREDLRIEVARRRLGRRETDAALRLLREGAARPRPSVEVLALLGLAEIQAGRPKEAEAAYRRAMEVDPEDLETRLTLGQLLLESKRPGDALGVLRDPARGPAPPAREAVEVADLLARVAEADAGLADECRGLVLGLLDGIEAGQVDDPRIAGRIAERNAALGRTDQAEAWFRRAREMAPANPVNAARLAEIYLQSGRVKEAAVELEALHRRDPTNPVPLYYLGIIALDQADPARAKDLFERAVLLNPEFEPAGLDLISAHLALDDAAGAVEAARRARERLRPGFRLEYLSGLAHARAKDWDAARTHFLKAEEAAAGLAPNPVDHRFLFQVGAFLEQAGRSEESVRYLERALALKPDFDEALNHLGYMWAEQGVNLDRALDMIQRAVAAEPDNAAYLDSLGWVLHRLNRHAEALTHLERAVVLLEDGPDATVLDHLGDVLQALGRGGDAREAWRKALEVEPSDAIRRKLGAP